DSHFDKVKKQFINNNIMYLDQLTSNDGVYLHNWSTISRKSFSAHAVKAPKWFKELQRIILQNHTSRKLLPEFNTLPATHHKGSILSFSNPNNRVKEFVVIWNPLIFQSIIGRIVEKHSFNNTCVIEH